MKKQISRKLIMLTITLMLTLSNKTIIINANGLDSTKPVFYKLGIYSRIIDNQLVEFSGENYKLYPTFERNDIALDNFIQNHKDFNTLLREYCNFTDAISNDAMINSSCFKNLIIEPPKNLETISKDLIEFKLFWDIFENQQQNKDILEIVSSGFSEENVYSLILALPSEQSDLLRTRYRNIMSKSSLSATYTKNIAAGNSYAMSYAITPNTINKYYYFAGSDCANFTSQILEAMGVPQDRSGV